MWSRLSAALSGEGHHFLRCGAAARIAPQHRLQIGERLGAPQSRRQSRRPAQRSLEQRHCLTPPAERQKHRRLAIVDRGLELRTRQGDPPLRDALERPPEGALADLDGHLPRVGDSPDPGAACAGPGRRPGHGARSRLRCGAPGSTPGKPSAAEGAAVGGDPSGRWPRCPARQRTHLRRPLPPSSRRRNRRVQSGRCRSVRPLPSGPP